jgi:hypothetical protein
MIHIQRKLDSETLHLPELKPLMGKTVEITVDEQGRNGSEQPAVANERFEILASNWKAKTKYVSNVTTKILNADYQKIIGMGKDAIPFILNDLADNGPNDWFWALTAITDVNPIKPEMAGNMVAMTEAWLQWGTQVGYLKDYPRTMNRSFQT